MRLEGLVALRHIDSIRAARQAVLANQTTVDNLAAQVLVDTHPASTTSVSPATASTDGMGRGTCDVDFASAPVDWKVALG